MLFQADFTIPALGADAEALEVLAIQTKTPHSMRGDFAFQIKLLLKSDFNTQSPSPLPLFFNQNAQLVFQKNTYFSGYIANISSFKKDFKGWILELEFCSHLYKLKTKNNPSVFTQQDLESILLQKLLGYFSPHEVFISTEDSKVLKNYVLPFEAQKSESDWNFLLRLVERFGLFLIWDFGPAGQSKLHIQTQSPSRQALAFEKNQALPLFKKQYQKYKVTIGQVQEADYDPKNPSQPISAEFKNPRPNAPTQGQFYHFGACYTAPELVKHLTKIRFQSIQAQAQVLHLEGLDPRMPESATLKLGDCIDFENQSYRIVQLNYEYNQLGAALGAQQESPQTQAQAEINAVLIPSETPFHLNFSHQSISEPLQSAHLKMGLNTSLNTEGQYLFQYDFEHENSSHLSSPWVHQMQNLADSGSNIHHPNLPESRVLIGHYYGQLQSPFVLGAILDPQTLSPVNQENSSTHQFISAKQHGWKIDDSIGQESILFYTQGAQNYFWLSRKSEQAGPEPAGIGFYTVASAHFKTIQNIEQLSQKDFSVSAQGELKKTVLGQGKILIQDSSLWQAPSLEIQSSQNTLLYSKATKIQSQEQHLRNHSLQKNAQNLFSLNCSGNLFLKSAQNLNIQSKSGEILISNAGSSIKISPQAITLNAKNAIYIQGHKSLSINYQTQNRN
ncbi:MAG: contractile injection system protein, VgrG/Pvc8 family [Gammaproteobacteria bacterium]